MNPPVPLPDARLFTHEAMHTTFSLRLIGDDIELVDGAAMECFDLLDHLEAKLSRFIDGSDVFRINRMHAGETLYLSEACHQCLLLAMQASVLTRGLFDISAGTRIQHRKSGAADPMPPLQGQLVIHPEAHAITCQAAGREIDLGGIGKGFALDQLHDLLLDWGVGAGLLCAGASSLLAFGPQPWPVDLAGDLAGTPLVLTSEALSASGTDMQGSHIVHPCDDEPFTPYLSKRVWAVSPTAAMAEAWSTALMLMRQEDVMDARARHDSLRHAYADLDGKVRCL